MTKSAETYAKSIRAAIRGLWAGEINFAEFVFSMNSAIERRLTEAWIEGAREAGIEPDELTPAEISALRDMVNAEFGFVPELGDRIARNNRASGGRLRDILVTVPLWANRHNQIKERARVLAGTNAKYKWVVHASESCADCLKLSGKVKRLSAWKKANIYPQHNHLECMRSANGVPVCKCRLVRTSDPVSRGRLPLIG